jgi:hypothetical protein
VLSVQYGLQDDYLFDTDETICSARGGVYKTAFDWVGGQWKGGKVRGFLSHGLSDKVRYPIWTQRSYGPR